jgi:hypothetical protein
MAMMHDTTVVDRLAQIIRIADGNHDMGAGELADAIVDSGFLWNLEEEARADQREKDAKIALTPMPWDDSERLSTRRAIAARIRGQKN